MDTDTLLDELLDDLFSIPDEEFYQQIIEAGIVLDDIEKEGDNNGI